ncbi:MAG: histidine phosphatase family protein [Oscillospiraceae bacterium]|jgi:probable phosphoglycerate mutase|nr:histidine phosphatase family protein [Oscillospiraceae bacterium]
MTKIYLIRHCESEGNAGGVFQGSTDSEISDKGKLQLVELAARFKDIHLDALYSSPLKRARATAEAVGSRQSLPVRIEPDLIEIHGGEWEGLTVRELNVPKYAEQFDHWYNNLSKFRAPSGESSAEIYERATNALMKIASEHKDQTVAVTSHGFVINLCLQWADGIAKENVVGGEDYWVRNTSVSLLQLDLKPSIVYMNDFAHLTTEELISDFLIDEADKEFITTSP